MPRSARIGVSVEPEVYVLLVRLANEHDLTLSNVVRKIILKDLEKQGLLSTEVLKSMVLE